MKDREIVTNSVKETQENFVAGGMLCGKSYEGIEKDLAKFGYQKLFLQV